MGNAMSGFYCNKSWWSGNKYREGQGPDHTTTHLHGTALQRQTRHLSRWRCFHLADRHLQIHLKTLPSPVLGLLLREGVVTRKEAGLGAACLR